MDNSKIETLWQLVDKRRLVLIRGVFLGCSIFLSLCFSLLFDEFFTPLSGAVLGGLMVLWFFDLFLSYRWERYGFSHAALASAVILTGVVYVSGLTSSPFVTLYLPAVMLFAINYSQTRTLLFAAFCGCSYGALLLLVSFQVLPFAQGNFGPIVVAGGLFIHLVGLYSGLVLVGVGTRFLVRHAQSGFAKAEASTLALKELSSERMELSQRLKSVEDQLALQERMARLLSGEEVGHGAIRTRLQEFIGESPIMQKVFELITRVAPSEATTLIGGESGTGKELVAKAIHLGSKRSSKKFITVNCGAIPESLIESELFGHKKGAFTGAVADHVGLFQEADGGTLFLDEIGELPIAMQAKLLRALQERTVRPVGGNKDIEIDVRILAATNRNLKSEVANGRFREDLYYRLNVISIHIPALRERKEDIPFLVNSLLKSIVGSEQMPLIPPTTMKLLTEYNYPGNVRELENILERAFVLGGEAILPEHLPEAMHEHRLIGPSAKSRETVIIETDSFEFPIQLDEILASVERKYLERALVESQGAKKKAAELLGINFRSFRYRLSKFQIGEEGLTD